ncbi:hypothetical protein TH53_09410 [Pedobacter lusitanus]|uniref:Major facilitator superfamily (MFS) profile domain-containing protein n=1 Tax=Pedobacter lusitanus TaxID=1503925 RepID=A0A0D0GSR0_9SPHI|nr:MFS transporter [Pedobacter lusitanus]KIO77506.1 hypothetical protein TH53_09410 [Pedobacter lusitanus]
MKTLSKTGIFVLLLTSSLTIMVGTVIAPSLTETAAHLGFTDNPGWLITLPALGVVLFAPLMGKLSDHKGPFSLMVWSLIPYAIFGVTGAVLNNPYIVIADRILLGAATAAIQTAGTGLIADFFEGEARMKMIAWQGMAIEIGGVVFLSLGGLMGESGWRFPFLIYLTALICLPLLLISVPRLSRTPVHLPGHRSDEVPKDLLKIIISTAIAMILFFIVFSGLPQYLPGSFHFSTSQTGYFMAFISLIAAIAASLMPRVVKKLSANYTVPLGFISFLSGQLLFACSAGTAGLLIAAVFTGIGFGFTIPLLNHVTIEISNPQNRGRNLSYYSMAVFGGQFLSSFIGGLPFDLKTIFMIAAFIALITAVILVIHARYTIKIFKTNHQFLNK